MRNQSRGGHVWTRGVKSEFRPQRLAGPPGTGYGLSIEGFRYCSFCQKSLSATEVAIRNHLRVHLRSGELKQEEVVEVFKDIFYMRKKSDAS